MKTDFFKFPTTPHLMLLGTGAVRQDKVLSQLERDEFLEHELTVEEKIDGANLGISFDSAGDVHVQNRGDFIVKPYQGQWKKLDEWLALKLNLLFDVLHDQYILFGEWCFARHSVGYDNLPSWFLGFDIYDRESTQFLSCSRRNNLFGQMKISQTPLLARGRFSLEELKSYFNTSCFSNTPSEGIYLRYDKGKWLQARAKLVRPEFVQAIEAHWSRTGITANKLHKDFYY